jgi:integrase
MPKLATPLTEVCFRNAKPGSLKPKELWKNPEVSESFPDGEFLVPDGKGLNLRVKPGLSRPDELSKVWIFRYRFGGKEKQVAIKGGYPAVSLKKAREEADKLRALVAEGKDPAELRKADREAGKLQAEEAEVEQVKAENTFEKVAKDWFKQAAPLLSELNGINTWRRLEVNILPVIGARPIAELKPPDILAPLKVVASRGAKESAQRILGNCSQIFRFAVHSGLIESDPTRDLRGALPKPVETHFAAFTDPKDVAILMRAVSGYAGDLPTRVALRLGILTFVRPGNLREAEWTEFHNLEDPEKAEWRIPGDKMKVKTKRPFIVPLAPQAIALVREIHPYTSHSRYLFPSALTANRPMSNNTVNTAFRRMGYTKEEITGHGVRAMARTLCHEVLGFAPEVIEEQLAHGKAGPLGGAYDRTTHMPERRRLMRKWASYLDRLEAGQV